MFITLRVTLCRSKYLSLFVRKSRQVCIQLRAQLHRKVRRQLNSELNRELRERLHAALYDALFAKLFETLFEKAFAALLDSSFESMFLSLWASTYLALCRPRLRGRRPPGRSPHDRIVVRSGRTTTCGRPARILAGGIESAPQPVHPDALTTRNRQRVPPVPRRPEAGLRRISHSETRCTKRHMNKSGAWVIRPVFSAGCNLAQGGQFKGGGHRGCSCPRCGPRSSSRYGSRCGYRNSHRNGTRSCYRNGARSSARSCLRSCTRNGSLIGDRPCPEPHAEPYKDRSSRLDSKRIGLILSLNGSFSSRIGG